MTAGKLETQISKDDGVVIIGTLLVCDDDRKLETQISNDGGDLIGTLLVCDDARKLKYLEHYFMMMGVYNLLLIGCMTMIRLCCTSNTT